MKRFIAAFDLLFFFLKELVLSNLRVAKDVLRRKPEFNVAIVAVPLALRSDFAILLHSSLITLTPGTLSLDLSEDKKTLFIHTLYLDNQDKAAFVNSIREGFEKRIARVFGQEELSL